MVDQVTDEDDYLTTQEHTLALWQLSLLDVTLFLLVTMLLVTGLSVALLWGVAFALLAADRYVFNRGITAASGTKHKAA